MGQGRERTAEERAENINRTVILLTSITQAARRDGATLDLPCQIFLELTLQGIVDVIDELREAKLARAKLELR